MPLLQAIDSAAIVAATELGRAADLGHFWGARGHNLHRQGFHREAILAFTNSARHYRSIGDDFSALKSEYMLALCWRALGDRRTAVQIVEGVLAEIKSDDPWRGNPLQVLGWLQRDQGEYAAATNTLCEALTLQAKTADPDILLAGTLADLGEISSLQKKLTEADGYFVRSLILIRSHKGQYNRQEARTLLKYAEHHLRIRNVPSALAQLRQADDLIRTYGGYYDLHWRLELAQAQAYFRLGRPWLALRKLRSMWRYRARLDNSLHSIWHMIRQSVRR